ncbi:hypothetical protein [Tistrella mobilis]|uniref:C-type lysozyme inhibitor domain-containing protein n=1 Tax=Tistrella mobilis (strain KA081020-065) TaxID=1110502 RepID=I3TT42_TISMK|nr:hypothetical protein [Tistrella mobilis]AFK55930.1 hypothetical protein TMO_a0527 [Tistrella mobilis KA081020-065]
MPRTAVFAVTSCMILAACGGGPSETSSFAQLSGPWSAQFSCADGSALKVRYEPDHAVIRTSDGEGLILPAVEPGRYETNRNALLLRGTGAAWMVAGRVTDCTAA